MRHDPVGSDHGKDLDQFYTGLAQAYQADGRISALSLFVWITHDSSSCINDQIVRQPGAG